MGDCAQMTVNFGYRQTAESAGSVRAEDANLDDGVSWNLLHKPEREGLRVVGEPRQRRHPAARLAIEGTVAVLVGVALTFLLARLTWPVLVALGLWAVAVYHQGFATASPMRHSVPTLMHSLGVVLSLTSLSVAIGVISVTTLLGVVIATSAATVVATVNRLVDRARRSVRILLVGDPLNVAKLEALWSAAGSVDLLATYTTAAASTAHVNPDMGFVDGVARAARNLPAEAVIVAPGGSVSAEDLRFLTWALEDSAVHLGVVGATAHIGAHRMRPGTFGGQLTMEVAPSRRSAWTRTVKTLADQALAAVLLVLVWPLLLALCAMVKIDSKGPAIFTQKRVGQHGNEFTIYKLRTMRADAEAMRIPLQRAHPGQMLFKLRDDPRVTRIGRFLRRSSLDELPQLVNVLKGEMSLIGPRPALPEEADRYDEEAQRRLALRPGISGLWQISGRSDLSWEEALALDLKYVDNWRLSEDALILARTVHAVVRSKGAF